MSVMGRINLQERIAVAIGQYDNDEMERSNGDLKQLNVENKKINEEAAGTPGRKTGKEGAE
jgi:hypothetical protein